MNDEIEQTQGRPGPRRWSDEWLYGQFSKNQDRLFDITQSLATQIGTFHQMCDQHREIMGKKIEYAVENLRGETKGELRRLDVRMWWIIGILVLALLGVVADLTKGKLTKEIHGGSDARARMETGQTLQTK